MLFCGEMCRSKIELAIIGPTMASRRFGNYGNSKLNVIRVHIGHFFNSKTKRSILERFINILCIHHPSYFTYCYLNRVNVVVKCSIYFLGYMICQHNTFLFSNLWFFRCMGFENIVWCFVSKTILWLQLYPRSLFRTWKVWIKFWKRLAYLPLLFHICI